MIAGRKLLVADDSPTYRKVIDLTFTDEGMEVTTVGDGQQAWDSLERSVPDVVLADVFMPGLSGYELCRLIKQSGRFGRIPVILLVGSFEPFDEAEARRVGADDVVTKPFQSIRDLVRRVGSLLRGKAGDDGSTAHEYSTLGLKDSNAASSAPADHPMPETNVTVFVEAASMTETDSTDSSHSDEPAESTCSADMDLQTADTMKLERFDDEPPAPAIVAIAYAQDDTAEIRPVTKTDEKEDSSADVRSDELTSAIGATEMSEQPTQQASPSRGAAMFDDALLDLGDFDSATQRALADDLILDLDYEEPVHEPLGETGAPAAQPVPELAAAATVPAEVIATAFAHEEVPVAVAELHEWAIVTEAPPVSVVEEDQSAGEPNLGLSLETIDAIARRAVEQLSEKVVREIAWEVVPELAELLIKKKLEEQK